MSDIHSAKAFDIVTPTDADLERATALPLSACPRRYCWWWQTLGFDWGTPVAEGCTFLGSKKPPGWPDATSPCRRMDISSAVDHYEPREPHLEDDGFDPRRFLGPQAG